MSGHCRRLGRALETQHLIIHYQHNHPAFAKEPPTIVLCYSRRMDRALETQLLIELSHNTLRSENDRT